MKSLKRVFIGLIICLVCSISILLVGCSSKEISLNDYIKVDFAGMNGKGKAGIYFDINAFESDFSEIYKGKDNIFEVMYEIENAISYKVYPDKDLSNEDKVSVVISFDESTINKKLKTKFKVVEQTVKVENLPEGTVIDIFEDIEVSFAGVSPIVSAKINKNSTNEFVKNCTFKVEGDVNTFKLGDTFKVIAEYEEYLAEDRLYIVESKEKEYKVENVDKYMDSVSELTQEIKQEISKEVTDYYEAQLAKKAISILSDARGDYLYSFNTAVEFINAEFENGILLYSKNPQNINDGLWLYSTEAYNAIYLIYKVDMKVTKKYENTENIETIYLPVRLKDIIISAEGNFDIVYSDAKIVNSSTRYDDVYREIVTANKDNYLFEEFKLE